MYNIKWRERDSPYIWDCIMGAIMMFNQRKKKSKKYTPETWENNNDQSISRQQIMIQQIHLLFEGSFPTKLCFLNKYSKMT